MLESCGVVARETHVRQEPETGCHAIDDRPRLDSRDDDLSGSIDPPQDLVTQRRASTPRDLDDIFDPERAT